MIDKNLIGRESKPVRVRIEADAVIRFSEAVGFQFGHRVPPTLVATFLDANIDGVDFPKPGTIHAGQKIVYHQPVRIGDTLTYVRKIKDMYSRSGKLGKMTFLVLETNGRNPAGELVFTASSTLISVDREGTDEKA